MCHVMIKREKTLCLKEKQSFFSAGETKESQFLNLLSRMLKEENSKRDGKNEHQIIDGKTKLALSYVYTYSPSASSLVIIVTDNGLVYLTFTPVNPLWENGFKYMGLSIRYFDSISNYSPNFFYFYWHGNTRSWHDLSFHAFVFVKVLHKKINASFLNLELVSQRKMQSTYKTL